ncbi:MAG: hypothetical protein QNK35_06245 [Bacteroides sp.]|nr:hypothetical protein [Bacteroides sp.]
MRNLKSLSYILLGFTLLFSACDKDDGESSGDVTGEVELFLLDSYELVNETPEIDPASVVLKEDPLLRYSDLKSYNAKDYFFKVTDAARERLEEMEHSVSGVAFGVTADGVLIYTGYFVPSYSSFSVQWIVIDPVFWHSSNRIYVNLGYPGAFEGVEIPDLRNDERILKIFRRDRNLTE